MKPETNTEIFSTIILEPKNQAQFYPDPPKPKALGPLKP